MKEKPLFSVVVIAKNEEKTLPRLLKSLEEFRERGGEFILVDTGSTDNTGQIASDWGAKVHVGSPKWFHISVEWDLAGAVNKQFCLNGEPAILRPGDSIFDFSATRNYAASLASNDVVAMPDCDEEYTALNIDAINKSIVDGTQQFEYDFVFSHKPDGSADVQFMHCKFYDRRKLVWKGIIHEVLVNTGIGDPSVQYLSNSLIKLEHWQNVSQDRTGYLRGLALDCYECPGNDRNWHYFGRELMWSGRPESAASVLQSHVSMKKWPTEAAQSLVYLGDIRDAQEDSEYAVELWNRATQTDCTRREPWLRLAQHYFHKGDHQRVACFAEAALTIPWSNYYGNRSHDYGGRPHELLYWAYCWMNRPNEARLHWDQARQYSQDDSRILHDAKFFMELPKVSIVIPHVGGTRKEELARCLDAIKKNANYPNYEVIVEEDGFAADNRGVAKTFNRGVEKAAGEYVMFLGDDCVPQPNFLIQAMLSLEGPINGLFKRGMVGLNDGIWCGKDLAPATHWLAHKDMLNYLPGAVFLHEEYHHLGCDDELTAWARMHGDFQWCERARIEHKNPVGDDVYKRVWDPERVRHDRALLQQRADHFNLKVGEIPEDAPEFNPLEKIAELEATVKAQAARLEQIHNDNIKLTEFKNKYGETFGYRPKL